MAKGKTKSVSKPKVKKALSKKKEKPIEEVILEAEKVSDKKIEKKNKKSKHSFPDKEKCKHTHTKKKLNKRLRVEYICTECGKVVRFGGR